MGKIPLDDIAERLAVVNGSALAEGLGNILKRRKLTPREQVLVWIGVLARLRSICDQHLGRTLADEVFATIEAAVSQERGKSSGGRRHRHRSRKSEPLH